MYLTYAEYQAMGGTVAQNEFTTLEMEAETIIDWYTFNRLSKDTTYPQEVKNCMYMLIDLLIKKQQVTSIGQDVVSGATKAAISSQSNDGVSISYNVMGAKDAYDMLGSEAQGIVRKYLFHVTNSLGQRLLYRGIYENE